MVATAVTFTHASVNSGTAVDLQAHTARYSLKNMADSKPEQGNTDIAEVNVGGFGENPIIVIEGVLHAERGAANTITHSLLLDFKQVQTPITLTMGAGTTPIYLKGRPSAGYSIGGSYANTMKVYITDLSLEMSQVESDQATKWNFSLTCIETKQ